MVKLIFEAQPPSDNTITLTFGRSKSEIRWTDRRTLTFDELARLLRQHMVGNKDGTCFTPATFTGTVRRMEQAARIDIAVLDADCGHSFDEIKNAVEAKGWKAIIHSTYSHLTSQTVIAADPADKWMAENNGTIAGYLLAKKGYLPRIVADATIADETRDNNTRSYLVQHAPCPKFRVILLLSSPWIAEEHESQRLANTLWRERVGALTHALGLSMDQSCSDTSRLFYLPRHKQGAEFLHAVVDGDPCPIWDLPDVPPPLPQLPQQPAKLVPVQNNHLTYQAPNGQWIDLTSWAAEYGPRFEILKALQTQAPQTLGKRISGVKQHIVCPHADDHVTGQLDTTGTYVVNASQISQANLPQITSGFVIHCVHNGCSGRDRLSHLHKLLCDGKLNIPDLTNPEFLTPDILRIDASSIIKSKETKVNNIVKENFGNIPENLYSNLPGVMGEIHRWIMETAHKPQPTLTLAAVLSLMASAVGQRVQLQRWHTRPNIYVVMIAYSGSGKEHPMNAIKKIAKDSGLYSEIVGVENVASDAGIINRVIKSPRQVMVLNEISYLLSSANAKNAASHIANVIETLLKLYSSSSSIFQSKSYADDEKTKTIDQPCVSLLGATTPDSLTEALTSKDIKNGLLSRIVLFDAGDRDPRIRPTESLETPDKVTEWVRAWSKVSPIPNPLARQGGEPVIQPRIVHLTQEAIHLAEAFEGEMHDEKIKARKNQTDSLYVRAFENAMKFALIRACADWPVNGEIDESNLVVDATTMKWATELSRATISQMTKASREITDSVFEKNMKSLSKLIYAGRENGKTNREIKQMSVGRQPKKTLDDLLLALTEAGEIFFVKGIKTRTKPRDAWVHRDFLAAHGVETAEEG
jgi:hypothetical protein